MGIYFCGVGSLASEQIRDKHSNVLVAEDFCGLRDALVEAPPLVYHHDGVHLTLAVLGEVSIDGGVGVDVVVVHAGGRDLWFEVGEVE